MEEHKCAFCGAREDLQIHHWLYLNTIRKQKTWTTILCRACHQKLHPNHGVGRGAKKLKVGRKVISELRTVNASQEAHLKIMKQRRKMEEEEGKVIFISDALDVLLGISNRKGVK